MEAHSSLPQSFNIIWKSKYIKTGATFIREIFNFVIWTTNEICLLSEFHDLWLDLWIESLIYERKCYRHGKVVENVLGNTWQYERYHYTHGQCFGTLFVRVLSTTHGSTLDDVQYGRVGKMQEKKMQLLKKQFGRNRKIQFLGTLFHISL